MFSASGSKSRFGCGNIRAIICVSVANVPDYNGAIDASIYAAICAAIYAAIRYRHSCAVCRQTITAMNIFH